MIVEMRISHAALVASQISVNNVVTERFRK